jgi:cysteine desulfurase / selenocysteine lyase
MAHQRGDIALKVLPILSSGDINLDLFKQALTARTKLVSFAHMSNVTGAVHPAKEICEICQSREIYTLVDGAQSAGHIPVNVAEIGCDFFTFSGHKLYGPTGIGVLVGKKSLLSKMPPMFGGGDMIESVSFEGVKYADIPQKFEAGTPRIAQVFGLGAAIDFLSSFGLEAIKAHEQMLMDFLTEELEKVTGLTLIGNPKRRTSIISFILDGIHSLDLASLLDTKGIAVRSGHLCAEPFLESLGTPYVTRISLGIYTTLDEIKKTIFELRNLLENLL